MKKMILIPLLAGVILTGCKNNETGTLKISLTDAPFPAEWVSAANVTIDRIEIRNAEASDTSKYVVLSEEVQSFNLLDLANGVTASLVNLEIPVGNYDLIRLRVSAAEVVMTDGTVYTLTIPSGSTSGIKVFINPDLEVAGGLTSELLLDFDVSKSFTVQGKVDSMSDIKGFHFKPVLRVANVSTTGRITGTVFQADTTGFPGVTVSVIAGDSVLTSAISDTEGKYTILGIPAGTYDLTAEAPNVETVTVTGVAVVAGNKTDQDIQF